MPTPRNFTQDGRITCELAAYGVDVLGYVRSSLGGRACVVATLAAKLPTELVVHIVNLVDLRFNGMLGEVDSTYYHEHVVAEISWFHWWNRHPGIRRPPAKPPLHKWKEYLRQELRRKHNARIVYGF